MSARRPYVRPVTPYWWARPPYLTYTLREATGLAVAAYALVLLAGVVALAGGEATYAAFLGFLKSPWSLALHAVILAAMVLHVATWFRIMPKTMPRLVLGGSVVPQRLITGAGLAVAVAAFAITLLIAKWIEP